jgi:uncharacterized membrane protein
MKLPLVKTKQNISRPMLAPAMPYILAIGGLIGIICSFILSNDTIESLKNPNFAPSCNINPVLSCGTVMHSAQGATFGFPNPWIGLIGFTAMLTVGIGMLAGAKFKRWFWIAFEIGLGGGVVFAYWLLYQSVYHIQALCPFCLTVDVVMTTVFWYLSLYIIREQHLAPHRKFIGIFDFARRYHLEILISWFLIIAALVLHHFWYYYGQFL